MILDQFEEYFLYHGGDGRPFAASSPRCRRPRAARQLPPRHARGHTRRARRVQGRGSRTCSGTTFGSTISTASAARAAVARPDRAPSNSVTGERRTRSSPRSSRPCWARSPPGDSSSSGAARAGGRRTRDERIEAPYPPARAASASGTRSGRRARTRCGSRRSRRSAAPSRSSGTTSSVRSTGSAPAQKDVAASIFDHLVTPSGTKIAHRVSRPRRVRGGRRGRARDGARRRSAHERILRAGRRRERRGAALRDLPRRARRRGARLATPSARLERERAGGPAQAPAPARGRGRRRCRARGDDGHRGLRARRSAARRRRRRSGPTRRELDANALASLRPTRSRAWDRAGRRAARRPASRPRTCSARRCWPRASARSCARAGRSSGGLQPGREAGARGEPRRDGTAARPGLVRGAARAAPRAPVTSASFSPDGRLVVTAGEDGAAKVWDAWTGRLVHTFRHRGPVLDAVFVHGGPRRRPARTNGAVWDVADGRLLRTWTHGGPGAARRHRPRRQAVVTVAEDPAGHVRAACSTCAAGGCSGSCPRRA